MDSVALLVPVLFAVLILVSALVNIRGQNKKIASLLVRATQKLETSEEELRLLANTFNSHEPIVIIDSDLKILRVNDAFSQVSGFTPKDALGKDFGLIASMQTPHARQEIIASLTEQGRFSGEITASHKDGEAIPMYLRATAIQDDKGETTHVVAVYSDISEQKRNEEVINSLAFYDPLTGLPNRRKIMDSIERELYLANRYSYSGALFFIDVDNFKTINDTLGHDHGDRLLIELGQRLCSQIRKADTVSRLGGDEFLILLQGEASSEQDTINHATSMASKLLSFHEDPYFIDGHKHFVSISIGITTFPGHATDPQELLKQADTALYKAKSMGRNTSCFFHPDMQKLAEHKREMEHNLREALTNEQFELHYQPQVDSSGEIASVEALLRWQASEDKLVAPTEFIQIAEDSGLIIPLGNWIMRTACQQMKHWLDEDMQLAHISVNVSPRQFRDAEFLPMVEQTLREVGLLAKHLMIELTESVVVENVDEAKIKMEALHSMGVRISMDDFGTGYSSLSYLSELPFHELKIDQSFIRNLFIDQKNSEIATTIIAMAKSLNLTVLAEGVEDHEQLTFLKEHECSMYQGYYFSKPLSHEGLEDILRDQRQSMNA